MVKASVAICGLALIAGANAQWGFGPVLAQNTYANNYNNVAAYAASQGATTQSNNFFAYPGLGFGGLGFGGIGPILLPMAIAGFGILFSIIGTMLVKISSITTYFLKVMQKL